MHIHLVEVSKNMHIASRKRQKICTLLRESAEKYAYTNVVACISIINMLERSITQKILEWRKTKRNECLLIMGARQIGKTYIVENIGRNHYKYFVEINFEQNPEIKSVFEGDLTIDVLISKISLYMPQAVFSEGETLVLLDEIQACPQARTSLKFWAIDNRFDVIATGSLLGLNYKEVLSYPVGYERRMVMHSLDFEEYLWAKGISGNVIDMLKRYAIGGDSVETSVHKKMMALMREYMIVGGMPAVVNKMLETNNYSIVHEEQQKIVGAYLNDIAKYAPTSDKPKARNCYLSLPRQLAKANTKFMYSEVETRGTARKYGNSLDWLRDANILTYCNNISTPRFPIEAYVKPEQFRAYANDIGLLVSMFGFEIKKAIYEDTLTGDSKGGIYENLVADFLLKKNIPLRYYCREDSSVEIEFVIEKDAAVIPIEVKAKRGKSLSLDALLKHDDIPYGYKFTSGNVGREGKKITMPLYLAPFVL